MTCLVGSKDQERNRKPTLARATISLRKSPDVSEIMSFSRSVLYTWKTAHRGYFLPVQPATHALQLPPAHGASEKQRWLWQHGCTCPNARGLPRMNCTFIKPEPGQTETDRAGSGQGYSSSPIISDLFCG